MDGEHHQDDAGVESGQELVQIGADTLAAAGGAAGSFLGPVGAIAGAAVTPVIGRLMGSAGRAIQRRFLSSKEEVRIGGALAVALGRIEERRRAGEQPRQDGLFDPDSDPRGLLEGTLRSAARSYDEKKVPFIGAFYASFVFEEDVNVNTGQFLLNLLDRLTYHYFCCLAYFADPATHEERMHIQAAAEEDGDRTPPILVAELAEMANLGLLGFVQPDGSTTNPGSTFGSLTITGKTLAGTAPTELGKTLVRMAELDKIPKEDQQAVGVELRGLPPS